jgi:hypothetical protein
MKTRSVIILSIFISVLLIFGCSRAVKNKIAGTWKVEDVKFESNMPMDPAKIESSKESAKAVSYELLDDNIAKVHVGSTLLEGTWTYKEAEAGVYMVFKGSKDTVLLGRYAEGKLINEANRPDLKITTIFKKGK